MKLYYFPGACSMASHITINELQLSVAVERVDLATKKTEHGHDFLQVNAEGYVPALTLDDGSVLTESAAVLEFLCDKAGPNTMLPGIGELGRYRVTEMLAYVSTEVHQSLRPLLDSKASDESKKYVHGRLQSRLPRLERLLSQNSFLSGSAFTIADAYAFVIISAARRFGVDLGEFPRVEAFLGRVASRPAVAKTMRAEGLAR